MQLSLIQRLRGSRDARERTRSSSSSSHPVAAIHHHHVTTAAVSSGHSKTASAAAAAAAAASGVTRGSGGGGGVAAVARESSGRLSYEARPFYPHGAGSSNDHLSHHQQQLGERLFPRVQSLRCAPSSYIYFIPR